MKYQVKIYEIVSHTVEVEADSSDSAYEVAYDTIGSGNKELYDTEAQGYTGEYDVYEIHELEGAK
jgi:hypothetical protein